MESMHNRGVDAQSSSGLQWISASMACLAMMRAKRPNQTGHVKESGSLIIFGSH